MLNNLFGGMFGSSAAASTTGAGLQNAYNPYQQQYGLASQYHSQQALANQYAAQQRHAFEPPKWVIDGRSVSINEFANELYGEDTPEKTLFLLKYGGK